jgi:hypothetical protein
VTIRRCSIAAALGVFVLGVVGAGAAMAAGGAVPPGKRLTTKQWQAYQKAQKTFDQTTAKTVKRFQTCVTTAGTSRNPKAFSVCIGKSLNKELAVTQKLRSTLIDYQGTVGRVCNHGFGSYVGQLNLWRSTVKNVNTVAQGGNMIYVRSAVKSVVDQNTRVKAAERNFKKVCAPA